MDLIRIIFAVILPPLGVFLQVGLGKHFWLNILLTILASFALWAISTLVTYAVRDHLS